MSLLKSLSELQFLPIGLRAAMKVHDKRATDLREIRRGDMLLVSYPKSGRTWLHVMISRLFTLRYGIDPNLLLEGGNLRDRNPAIPRFCISHLTGIDPNTDQGFQRAVSGKKLLLLVRHPIDVAVSTYHHHAGGRINPRKLALKRHLGYTPEDAASTSLADFVADPRWGVPDAISYMNNWRRFAAGRAGCHIVRYEDLVAVTAVQMRAIDAFLGSATPPEVLAAAIEMSGLEALREQEKKGVFRNASMKARDSSNPDSFKVRRGKALGYKDELAAEDVARLQAMINATLDPAYGYRS